MERRDFLNGVGSVAATGVLAACSSVDTGNSNGRGPPRSKRSNADFIVATADQFSAALDAAVEGETVYVAGDAEVNLTGRETLEVPGGVTLASAGSEADFRNGAGDFSGGTVFTDDPVRPALATGGDDVTVDGLRLRGNTPEGHFEPGTDELWSHDSVGIRSDHANTEVRNCDISNWSHSGVLCNGSDERVHHCRIHDNSMTGLGYGVSVNGNTPVIEYNYFNMNRHSVAGSGEEGNGYVCRFNLHGPDTTGHMFDVHPPGGDRFGIYRNVFTATETIDGTPTEAVVVRGEPSRGCDVHHNAFAHRTGPVERPVEGEQKGTPIKQTNTGGEWANLQFWSNWYGHRP